MDEYKIVGIGNVSLICTDASSLEHSLDKKILSLIDSAWDNAVKLSGGRLSNGTLFSCTNVASRRAELVVEGSFVPYKYFWAQRNGVCADLAIRPVGVSGILLTQEFGHEFVTFAKRTLVNLQYPGYYELVPSGGIERGAQGEINYHEQLRIELYEEVGIGSDKIKTISTLGVLFDIRDKVYDIGCALHLQSNKEEIALCIKNSTEYEDVQFVKIGEVENFLKNKRGTIVPASIGLIEMLNAIKA